MYRTPRYRLGFIMVAGAVRIVLMANYRLPASRITIIYNGVDIVRFVPPSSGQREEARKRSGFAAEDFVVGMVAAFRAEKNYEVFFDALSQAARQIPSLRILAVGAGPLAQEVRERVVGMAVCARTEAPRSHSPRWSRLRRYRQRTSRPSGDPRPSAQ
jgi:glycosyltransferase involved in cell wall biosynthesis